jgi:hypothetical protein
MTISTKSPPVPDIGSARWNCRIGRVVPKPGNAVVLPHPALFRSSAAEANEALVQLRGWASAKGAELDGRPMIGWATVAFYHGVTVAAFSTTASSGLNAMHVAAVGSEAMRAFVANSGSR